MRLETQVLNLNAAGELTPQEIADLADVSVGEVLRILTPRENSKKTFFDEFAKKGYLSTVKYACAAAILTGYRKRKDFNLKGVFSEAELDRIETYQDTFLATKVEHDWHQNGLREKYRMLEAERRGLDLGVSYAVFLSSNHNWNWRS